VKVAVVSYRLGGADGVSTEAAKWINAFRSLGCSVTTVAGDGEADCVEPGLAAGPSLTGPSLTGTSLTGTSLTGMLPPPPDEQALRAVLAPADLVVVENLCSLPLNPVAGAVVARVLSGRPALMHHHDLPWQRAAFRSSPPPPDDPQWCHVVTTELSRVELLRRGIDSVTVHNLFDPRPPQGDREAVRQFLGVGPDERLVVQPTRAIARKGIPSGVALAEALGAHYWLVGRAEEGYEPTLEKLLASATVPTHRGVVPGIMSASAGIEHAYAAADVVAFPSTWEGFGNPPVEASLHLRPVAVGQYPALEELRSLGFKWLDAAEPDEVRRWLANPKKAVLDHNRAVATRDLNLDDLPRRLADIMKRLGLQAPAPAPAPRPSEGEGHGASDIEQSARY
jgi:glycosyltransferase involved in cell wall biosynthesis